MSILSEYKHIKLIQFLNLKNWDYYSLSGKSKISSNYTIIQLKDVITLRKRFITIDDSMEYKRCRVQLYGKGVLLRDEVLGEVIKTKRQQICQTDDFLVAEIDAKFGGYGIVPKNLEDAIVSSHYFLYEINKLKLLPDFLGLVIKLEQFSSQVKATGSTNYAAIRPNDVLGYQIPLPDVATQKKIIESYYHIIDKADKELKESGELEKSINDIILDFVNIRFTNNKAVTKFDLIDYKEMERWSVEYLKSRSTILELKNSKFPLVRVKSFLIKAQYGLSSKANEEVIGIPMLRMNNIQNGQLDISNLKYIPESIESIRNYLLEKGDLLFNRTNSKELVGKTAVFDLDDDFTFASYIIRLQIDKSKVNVHYINYLFNSEIGRKQIDITSRQVLSHANVNSQELQNLMFPIPDIQKQNQLVQKLDTIRSKISHLIEVSTKNRNQAIKTFESLLFKL